MNKTIRPNGARRTWRPAPVFYGSAALHAGAIAAWAARPSLWPWPLATLAINHALLTAAGLWPRSRLLGPNMRRLPLSAGAAVAITIDDGPDPDVTPPVLAQLARFDMQATFFCVGERVLRHPELAREIVRRGHAIENHSQRHRHNFSLLGPAGMRAEISRGQDSIFSVTGSMPLFFRAPAGLRNPFLEPVLARLGLRLASWTRRGFDTVTTNPEVVYRRVAAPAAARDILLLHDGNAARDGDGTAVILEVLPRLLDALRCRGLRSVTLRSAVS